MKPYHSVSTLCDGRYAAFVDFSYNTAVHCLTSRSGPILLKSLTVKVKNVSEKIA